MRDSKTKPKTIDEYLDAMPEDSRRALEKLRATISAAAPEATEGFSYGMPAFRLNGRPLVAFAAFKGHCSLFPMGPETIESFEKELEPFRTAKGTLQFTPDRPIPQALVKKIVRERVKRLSQK